MKKLFLLSTLLMAFVFTTFAQTDNQPAPISSDLKKEKGKGNRKAEGNHLKKALGLNDNQANKMKDARATMQGKMKAIKSDNSLSKEEKAIQFKTATTAFDSEMKGILTPEQYTKWGGIKEKMKGKLKEKRKGKKGLKQEDDMEMPDDGQ
jgi:periplasmic protein CpxP/Spy